MRIEQVDPRDDVAFGRWFDVLQAVERDNRPGEPGWTARDQQAMATAGSDPSTAVGELITLLLAVDDDGHDVAMARLLLTVRDNLDRAGVLVHVRPEHRRRGVGSALLAEVESRARAAGRSWLAGNIDEPERLAGCSPARAFAEARGFDCVLKEVRRDLALPADPAVLASARAEAAAAAAAYSPGITVRTYRDRCPDDLVAQRALLGRAMSVMYPSGDMEVEEEDWDADRVRRTEALFREMGRGYWAAVALLDGEAVAFTELGVSADEPTRAYQWDTLVLPAHRGHRLGLLLKAVALEQLQVDSPVTRLVTTWNAEVNAPMIAVNERLGFRPNGTLATWQKRL